MTITFSGDICVANSIKDLLISSSIRSIFEKADYKFACFEAPINFSNSKPFNKVGPTLSQHKDIAKLSNFFTHVSIANNHIMDYGNTGLKDTIEYLQKNNIAYAGAGHTFKEAYEPIYLIKNGIKVAVLCLAESQFGCCRYNDYPQCGYAWLLNPHIHKQIQSLKKSCDYVICFTHAGLEMCDYPLPEWRSCYHSLIDSGCDIVIASHPHVIQGKEEYKGKSIYYSLGNFYFNNKYNDKRWTNSLSLFITLEKRDIEIKEIFTNFTNNAILLSDNHSQEHFTHLSSILEDSNIDIYIDTINREVIECWKKYYESYFSYPIYNNSRELKMRIFRRLFHKYLSKTIKPKVPAKFLFHNMMVDTHRFAISRAISILEHTY